VLLGLGASRNRRVPGRCEPKVGLLAGRAFRALARPDGRISDGGRWWEVSAEDQGEARRFSNGGPRPLGVTGAFFLGGTLK